MRAWLSWLKPVLAKHMGVDRPPVARFRSRL